MTIAPQLMSSARTGAGTDEWFTPDVVLDRALRVGSIFLDPCTSDVNPVGARYHFTEATNGLVQDWSSLVKHKSWGVAWVNWPYSKSRLWADKCAHEASLGVPIIALCAARPDTKWWRVMWDAADVVAFWHGRITFVGAPHPAPFPSALFGLNVSQRRFKAAFEDVAECVCP